MRIRNLCGLLGVILPWLALFSAGIAPHPSSEWWWSISATYYQSPALVGVLVPACIVLISYIGYDSLDNWVTSLSGVFGLGIVLFPCKVSWLEEGEKVGFFQLRNIQRHPRRLCGPFLHHDSRQQHLPVHKIGRHGHRQEADQKPNLPYLRIQHARLGGSLRRHKDARCSRLYGHAPGDNPSPPVRLLLASQRRSVHFPQ